MEKCNSLKINILGLLNYSKFAQMKIIFFGSPPFSAYILEQLHINFNVVAVVCPLDNEKGRGRKITAPAVRQKAEELKIELLHTFALIPVSTSSEPIASPSDVTRYIRVD